MSFKKNLLVLSMALAVVAVVAPSAALATTFESEGVPLENGAEVSALGTNVKVTTSAGAIQCSEFEIVGDVANNGEEEAEVEVTNIRAEGGGPKNFCGLSSSPGIGIKLTNIWGGVIIFFPDTTDLALIEFTFDIEPFGIECHFLGIFETEWEFEGSMDTIKPSKLTGSGAGCPTEGVIEGNLKLQNGVTIGS